MVLNEDFDDGQSWLNWFGMVVIFEIVVVLIFHEHSFERGDENTEFEFPLKRIDDVMSFGIGLVEKVKVDSSGERELFTVENSEHARN